MNEQKRQTGSREFQKQRRRKIRRMSDVPDEILREILSRLPVKPLLRFRCVSKSWKDLIDSPQFIKQHLNHCQKTNSDLKLIIRRCHLYCADFDSLNEAHLASFQELNHPLKTPDGGTEILGSCDGLLVLSNGKEDNFFWNPSNKRFHKLVVSGIEFPEYFTVRHFIVYGFGYDFVTDDYKLVRIVQFCGNGNNYGSEVKVYSLKSRSWRRIPDFPYYLNYEKAFGQLSNGALHWVVRRNVESDTDDLIVAFDLGTEEYRLVTLPEFAGDEILMNVGVLGGHLTVMCNYYMNRVDIWVMKEYGVKESWWILFTLNQCDVRTRDFGSVTTIAYSKCGRKVLIGLDNGTLVWYELVKKTTDLAIVQWLDTDSFEFHTCLQTLVLLDGATRNFCGATIKDEEGKGKNESLRKRYDFLSKGFHLVRWETGPRT